MRLRDIIYNSKAAPDTKMVVYFRDLATLMAVSLMRERPKDARVVTITNQMEVDAGMEQWTALHQTQCKAVLLVLAPLLSTGLRIPADGVAWVGRPCHHNASYDPIVAQSMARVTRHNPMFPDTEFDTAQFIFDSAEI